MTLKPTQPVKFTVDSTWRVLITVRAIATTNCLRIPQEVLWTFHNILLKHSTQAVQWLANAHCSTRNTGFEKAHGHARTPQTACRTRSLPPYHWQHLRWGDISHVLQLHREPQVLQRCHVGRCGNSQHELSSLVTLWRKVTTKQIKQIHVHFHDSWASVWSVLLFEISTLNDHNTQAAASIDPVSPGDLLTQVRRWMLGSQHSHVTRLPDQDTASRHEHNSPAINPPISARLVLALP